MPSQTFRTPDPNPWTIRIRGERLVIETDIPFDAIFGQWYDGRTRIELIPLPEGCGADEGVAVAEAVPELEFVGVETER